MAQDKKAALNRITFVNFLLFIDQSVLVRSDLELTRRTADAPDETGKDNPQISETHMLQRPMACTFHTEHIHRQQQHFY